MFNNLPGVIVNTVDGGLAVRRVPRTHSTLIIGTAGKGIADQPYQVTDPAKAALEFGFEGNLLRACEEARTYCDNIILFRMATKAAVLSNLGLEYATAKTISNVARTVGGEVTITATAHGYTVGDTVKVAAVTNTTVNGTWEVTAADANTFKYQTSATTIIASGADTGSAYKRMNEGVSLAFGVRSTDAVTRYSIWYKDGILAVWYDENLVYSNDSTLAVDTGDITVTGLLSAAAGLQLGTGATPTLDAAILLDEAPDATGTATEPAPTLTDPVTGVEAANQTGRKLFIAFLKATDLLDGIQVDQLVVPDAKIDQPNIAFKVGTDVINDPAVNADALDWLKTTVDTYGNKTYKWASDTVDSEGVAAAAAGPFANSTTRLAAGYNEVNWGYAMANFAAKISKLAKQCIAFIGTSAPKTFKLVDVRQWVGFLPTYDSAGKVTAPGAGLCGIPYLVGTTAAKLHAACKDKANGREAGFFETAEGQYDGTVQSDKNGYAIDIGAYLHVVADHAYLSNGWGRAYIGPITAVTAGYCAALDEKSALTNKPLRVRQLPALAYIPGQLDSLTQAKVNVLRGKGLNASPALLHDMSAATDVSDYTLLLRTRVKGRYVQTLLEVADPFIGESSLDGLQLQALKTALDQALVELGKRGYGSNASVVVSTTAAEQRLGHATLDLSFRPADELVQLTAQVGLVR